MKKLFFLILIFAVCGIAHAQMRATDSISGGKYIIHGNALISALVEKTAKANCTSIAHKDDNCEKKYRNASCMEQAKVMGFKIQLVFTKDRNAAERTKLNFSRDFSQMFPELVYTTPDYRVLAGDYFCKTSASEDLILIKKEYPNALIVPWRVWCSKAK